MELVKDYLDPVIFGTLGIMSFIMIALVIERFLYFLFIKENKFKHIELLRNALTRNLTMIASIGSNAPYIGLLGTVIGIMVTFHDMGANGNIDVSTIMSGLAMALKATAAGLFVAIPSIFLYNLLMRRVDVLISRWQAQQDLQEAQ